MKSDNIHPSTNYPFQQGPKRRLFADKGKYRYNKPMTKLQTKLSHVPKKPGVYKFLSATGAILYVGKAKNLQARLRQYFGGSDTRPQLPFLMAEATDFDYTVVPNEFDSLLLENELIKEYLPPYNIKLRDDKNYAFIKIDYGTAIPQITYARTIETEPKNRRKTSKYFGPYSSTKKIRQVLDFARRIFPYCANKEVGTRPCFYYYLHRCPGVCIGEISLAEYDRHLARIALFLSGKTEEAKKQLTSEMNKASLRKQYEKAARLRDQLHAVEVLSEKQLTIFPTKVDWDIVAVYTAPLQACVNLFKIRAGKMTDKENFVFDYSNHYTPRQTVTAVLRTFLESYYLTATDLPNEILLPEALEDTEYIAKLLRKRKGKKISLKLPEKGKKAELLKLGQTNAQEYLLKWQRSQASNLDGIKLALDDLAATLNLPKAPARIECYDISNIQGTNPVGSMVVFQNGQPNNSEYRKFKITSKQTPDDFQMMREMLSRRLSRIHPKDGQTAWPTPDLIVIDGGKGQLGVAVNVLEQLQLRIPVIGLAKRIEEIFQPYQSRPILLPHDNPALQMLQRLRDEAHRFGITFHRQLRSKSATKSALDTIPGIGPKTKKLLKQHFGTLSAIKQASLSDLTKIIGSAKAEIIKKSLK